jgi:hypothetical protein
MDKKAARRRRSSSLMYTEPPESLEHISDQAALPNLNSEWVNAKGESREQVNMQFMHSYTDTLRCLGHSFCPHRPPQNHLRHCSQHLARNIVDSHKHLVHGRLLSHVPLGTRRAL